jgi:ligand-binding sensor domain-containing protein
MTAELNLPRLFSLGVLLFFVATPVQALDPNKFITQYSHTAWRMQDGYVNGPAGITQTTDGYIWIGTRNGLVRFDGVKFTVWTPPEGQALPGRGFGALLGGRDGSLWIGTPSGLAHLKDGQLYNFPTQSPAPGIAQIIEDQAGTIWVTRYRVNDGKGPLCRVAGKELQCFGKDDGIPAKYALGLAKDSAGNFWFGSSLLYRWAPGSAATAYFEKELEHTGGNGVIDVAVGRSGTVWATLDGIGPELGVRYYKDGKWASYVVPGFNGAEERSDTLFVDREDSLWVGTEAHGLYHIHDGIADRYGVANGLSGNAVGNIFEDREGNIWVVTDSGVDFFRDTPVTTFSMIEGMHGANVRSVIAMSNGEVWAGNEQALDILGTKGRSAIKTLPGLPGQVVQSLLEDRAGRVWLGVDDRLMIYEQGGFSAVKKADGSPLEHVGSANAIVEDVEGNVWALVYLKGERHLLRFRDRKLQEDQPLDSIVPRAAYLAADRQSGIWIGGASEKIARQRNGQTEIIPLPAGDGVTSVYALVVDAENAAWASTNKGLFRWKDGRLSLMDSRSGLPCSAVFAAIEDGYGSLWLYAQCGLLKLSAENVAAWLKVPETKVSVRVFDQLDGASPATGEGGQPRAARSRDGRLWFGNGRTVQMIDPSRPYLNEDPPPVHIEELIADRKKYDLRGDLRLPPLRGELEIDYTALSLSIPRKVNFRFKLEGHDPDWQESGTRRQAFYNSLPPGKYRFRVIACNSDGVWNEVGAALDFSIAPTWYQTWWFRTFAILAVLLTIFTLYRLRVRQIANGISARYDERLAERTRLARELHDTFLQTVQASKMIADDTLDQTTDAARLRRTLEQLSKWLGQAMDEGRAALNSLRTSTTERNDLAAALQRATETTVPEGATAVEFSVVGEARDMHPIVRDEVYRIGFEAIRNACIHSGASKLEVNLRYEKDLVLRVKDNGVGMDPQVVAEGKDGHYGLPGMRERALRIGAQLTITSSPADGTEVLLVVPGGMVFRSPGDHASAL